MRYELSTPEPPRIRVRLGAGRVEVETADTQETVVEVEAVRGDVDSIRVEQHGREILIEHRKRLRLPRDEEYEVVVRAPHGAEGDLNLASADVRVRGRLGALELNTASGDAEVELVERDARVRSASGDVSLGEVGGKADVNTASGDVTVRAAGGGVSVRSASGEVALGAARGRVSANTASGDVMLNSIAEGSVDVKSASGDIRIGVAEGSRFFVDARSMSGETSSELEVLGAEPSAEGPLVELKATTMSGDIRLVRAQPSRATAG